jgi:hypothetical protein
VTTFDRVSNEIAKMSVHQTDLIVRGLKRNVQNPEQAEKLVGIVHQAKRFSVKGKGEFLWRSWRSREVSRVVARLMGNVQPYWFLEPANPSWVGTPGMPRYANVRLAPPDHNAEESVHECCGCVVRLSASPTDSDVRKDISAWRRSEEQLAAAKLD